MVKVFTDRIEVYASGDMYPPEGRIYDKQILDAAKKMIQEKGETALENAVYSGDPPFGPISAILRRGPAVDSLNVVSFVTDETWDEIWKESSRRR